MSSWKGAGRPARGLVAAADAEGATRLRAILDQAFPGIEPHVAQTPDQAWRVFTDAQPGVALIGTSLADCGGTIAQMAERVPRLCIVVYARHIADDGIFPALRAGACGYLLQHEAVSTLASELRAIQRGGRPLSPGMARMLLRYFTAISPREALDADEYRVLEGIASGATVHSLTSRLGQAVSDRIRRIYEKLARSGRDPAPNGDGP